MKDTNPSLKKNKRDAEAWVEVARIFGEQCMAIQQDSNLNFKQKLDKQSELSQNLIKEINSDSDLKDSDRKIMLDSIQSYMKDWTEIYQAMAHETENKKK